MNLFKKTALVMLVAVWVPATSHCLLVALSGLQSLTCCSPAETGSTTHPDDGCDADVCAGVESGLYKTELEEITPPPPMLSSVILDRRDQCEGSANSLLDSGGTAEAPLELLPSLNFRLRTALPARAPDAAA